jgi:hypothetical protein
VQDHEKTPAAAGRASQRSRGVIFGAGCTKNATFWAANPTYSGASRSTTTRAAPLSCIAYNLPMPRANCSIQGSPTSTVMIFYVGNKRIGPVRRYSDEQSVFTVLRRAHANLETIQIVEMALAQRRPCNVTLELSDEQYRKLSGKTS